MKVYLELVILNNLLINSFILILTVESCHLQPKWWRIICAAIVGTCYSVSLPYLNFANNFFIKIILSLVMVGVVARFKNFAKYIFCLMFFYIYTFLLAGMTYAVLYAFDELLTKYMFLPSVIGGSAIVLYAICKIAINHVVYTKRQLQFEQNISILVGKNKVECVGFWDSGNSLCYRGFPVIVLSRQIAEKLNLNLQHDCTENKKFMNKKRNATVDIKNQHTKSENYSQMHKNESLNKINKNDNCEKIYENKKFKQKQNNENINKINISENYDQTYENECLNKINKDDNCEKIYENKKFKQKQNNENINKINISENYDQTYENEYLNKINKNDNCEKIYENKKFKKKQNNENINKINISENYDQTYENEYLNKINISENYHQLYENECFNKINKNENCDQMLECGNRDLANKNENSKQVLKNEIQLSRKKIMKIKVECVTGSKYLEVARVDKLVLFADKVKTIDNQYVAISDEPINYDVILNYGI